MDKMKRTLREYFPFSLKNMGITLGILAAAYVVCSVLPVLGQRGSYEAMFFILAVFLVARYTDGYLFGLLAACISVLAVNFVFTQPYFAFNFTSGYPLTMLCMLVVAVLTGSLTTRAKRQEELRLVAEREKTRSNLLRAVSHDLRTPLTSIMGAVAAVAENEDALSRKERSELLSGVQDDAQWLIRVVENLLTITRIEGDDWAGIQTQPEAAEEVLAEAVAKFGKRFPRPQVDVQVPDELLMVPMDAMLVVQVLINMMENAVLHGKADRIRVAVVVAGKNALFTVKDNGNGINEALLPHIFKEKYRQAETGSDRTRGMGIGLSVCRTIIKVHGGSIAAQNLPGGGAEFSFTLPLEEKHHE